jgi:hypothetical protein
MNSIPYLLTQPRRRLFFCAAIASATFSAVSVASDLPAPIVPDAPVVVAKKGYWAVQLGSGSVAVLTAQVAKLKPTWSDARVVMMGNQGKLVVGHWDAPGEAAPSLAALRAMNAQAFVRQVPSDAPVVDGVAPTVAPVAAPAPRVEHTPLAKPVIVPTVPAPETMPVQATKPVVNASSFVVAHPIREPVIAEFIPEPLADDVLPAVVSVASYKKEAEVSVETTQLQIAAESLDAAKDVKPKTETVLAAASSERPSIVLPLHEKESWQSAPHAPLVEPLNLMLSPFYALPDDTTAKRPNALTMERVLQALIKPSLPTTPQEPTTQVASSAPEPNRKTKLFAHIAQLANGGLWESALPLAKEAKDFPESSLSAVDRLLLGWVWLQNKQPKVARRYFYASLKQQPQDEARYALGLCYLLLGEKAETETLVQDMAPSRQRNHLRSLLAH